MHSVAKITRKMIAIGNPIGRKCKMIYIGIKITNRMTDFESDHFQKYAETSQLWVQISFQSMASNGFPLHVDGSTLKFDGSEKMKENRVNIFAVLPITKR